MTFEHGWPFNYLRREALGRAPAPPINMFRGRAEDVAERPSWGIPWLSADNWRIWEASVDPTVRGHETSHWSFNGGVLLCDAAIALLVLCAVTAAWEYRRRRRPNLWSFRLGELFIVFTTVSAGLGWMVYLEREYQREARLIERNGTIDRSMSVIWFDSDQVCVAPTWIRTLLGECLLPAFTWRTASVQIQRPWRGEGTSAMYKDLSEFDYLTKVVLENGHMRDQFRFSALKSLARLETLEIWDCTIDEQNANELKHLTQLRKIVVEANDEIAPDALARLHAELPNCRAVSFDEDW